MENSLKPKRINFEKKWEDLVVTVKDVITLNVVERVVWNNSFSDVYSICVSYPEPLADPLYNKTKDFLAGHVKSLLAEKVLAGPDCSDGGGHTSSDSKTNNNNTLLLRYFNAWSEYSRGLEYLNHLYMYLNTQHIRKQKMSEVEAFGIISNDNQERMEIGELGLDIWRIYMIESLGEELVKQILDGIQADRLKQSGLSDMAMVNVINGVIQSLVQVQEYKKKFSLKLYQELFERKLLTTTGEYYRTEALKLLNTCTVSEYMKEAIKKLDEERVRASKFLPVSSINKIRSECEERLITDHLDFLYSECKDMVALEKREDLKNMYIVLKPVKDGLKTLIEVFLDHIKNEGIETISTLKGENVHIQFVENMLDVHQKYEELICDTFSNDPQFLSALDKACSSVINKRLSDKEPCHSAEWVARYCDSLLKKSKSTESEIEQKLSKSITIFKYIEDKDVYQKFYSRMLAKRLIHEQSLSMDAEEAMINRLKQACGYEFTNKIHRMFTDISLSADLNNKFNHYLKQKNLELGINLTIKILQHCAWPLGKPCVAVPFAVQEFEKSIQLFEQFYSESFNGRKLTWLHYLCHGELKISYLKKSYLVTMQTYQMAILMLFETVDQMTYKEIGDSLKLTPDVFQKHMQSLLESKLLLASADNLEPETAIRLNFDYSNKRTKFKITAAIQKETPQEVEHVMNSVDEDRKLYLQAAIVRIMKSRKILRHNALIQEILAQSKVSFAPSIPMIKKCIESLIDKQYIERTPNSGDEYSYVA